MTRNQRDRVIRRSRPSDRIDRLISWLKWPSAVLALVLLPLVVVATFLLIREIVIAPQAMWTFLAGFAAYLGMWWLFFKNSRISFFLTLEHELTHALFALATWHRITNLRVTMSRGGHIQFVGRGNWLIMVAPYFFPTITLALIPGCLVLPSIVAWMGRMVLGASFAYHLTSAIREIHPRQTDLQRAGFFFSFAFLPTANLIFGGMILAFVHQGAAGLGEFLLSIFDNDLIDFSRREAAASE